MTLVTPLHENPYLVPTASTPNIPFFQPWLKWIPYRNPIEVYSTSWMQRGNTHCTYQEEDSECIHPRRSHSVLLEHTLSLRVQYTPGLRYVAPLNGSITDVPAMAIHRVIQEHPYPHLHIHLWSTQYTKDRYCCSWSTPIIDTVTPSLHISHTAAVSAIAFAIALSSVREIVPCLR